MRADTNLFEEYIDLMKRLSQVGTLEVTTEKEKIKATLVIKEYTGEVVIAKEVTRGPGYFATLVELLRRVDDEASLYAGTIGGE